MDTFVHAFHRAAFQVHMFQNYVELLSAYCDVHAIQGGNNMPIETCYANRFKQSMPQSLECQDFDSKNWDINS